MNLKFLHSLAQASMVALLATGFAGCRKDAGPPPSPPPAEVSVVVVSPERIELVSELPGRVNPVREAQVRARADGILLKRLFEEGSNVREGQVLFEIDPAPLQARLSSARAAMARAEADLKILQADVARYESLVEIDAISRQVYDQAVAARTKAEAEVLATTAEVQTAELNLGYTKVTAPISGRIGRALVTEGALVSATEATQLAVIRQLDPVYLDLVQSSAEVLRLRRALATGAIKNAGEGSAKVTLILEDAAVYDHPGRLLFADIAVDPTTGMITLRAEFPNPENLLMSGMFDH
jgi:membrane fusion protein (multidrug efflux system)